jgi:hypothetical protein
MNKWVSNTLLIHAWKFIQVKRALIIYRVVLTCPLIVPNHGSAANMADVWRKNDLNHKDLFREWSRDRGRYLQLLLLPVHVFITFVLPFCVYTCVVLMLFTCAKVSRLTCNNFVCKQTPWNQDLIAKEESSLLSSLTLQIVISLCMLRFGWSCFTCGSPWLQEWQVRLRHWHCWCWFCPLR